MKARKIDTGKMTYSKSNHYYNVNGTNLPNCTKHALQCAYNYSDKWNNDYGNPYHNSANKSMWNNHASTQNQYRSQAKRGDWAIFAGNGYEHVAFVSEVHNDYLITTEQNYNEGEKDVFIRALLPKQAGVNDYRGRKLIGFVSTHASGKITAKQKYNGLK